jgi:hypothetical protein
VRAWQAFDEPLDPQLGWAVSANSSAEILEGFAVSGGVSLRLANRTLTAGAAPSPVTTLSRVLTADELPADSIVLLTFSVSINCDAASTGGRAFEVVLNRTRVLHGECRDADRSAPSLGPHDPPTRWRQVTLQFVTAANTSGGWADLLLEFARRRCPGSSLTM